MANEENIRKVISMIEKKENYFDMCSWDSNDPSIKYPENVCGTPACIGGWSEAIIRYEQKIEDDDFLDEYTIAEWLGISDEAADELFYGDFGDANRQQAIAHLNHIIKTSEVDWSLFVE